jgi:hypothetical protein
MSTTMEIKRRLCKHHYYYFYKHWTGPIVVECIKCGMVWWGTDADAFLDAHGWESLEAQSNV